MSDFKTYIKVIFAMAISFFEYLVGGFDTSIKTRDSARKYTLTWYMIFLQTKKSTILLIDFLYL